MALTRESSRSWFPDSTRGGYFRVSENRNPGPRIPAAPDGVRDVGLTMLETEDAIRNALDQGA
jgi:hypothetical protein